MKKIHILLAIFLVSASTGAAHAVNFYDGVRPPDGLYFLTYTSLYFADEVTDSDGEATTENYGFYMPQELVRFALYRSGFSFNLVLRGGGKYVKSSGDESWGFGDMDLGIGHFLPVKGVDILPLLFVKIPTGKYDSDESLNYGSNQFDLKPSVFLHKTAGNATVDLAAKYYIRFENPDTDTKPGNELYLQGLFGYEFFNFMKIGLSLNWMKSGEKTVNGSGVDDSERESFSAGSDLYFRFKPVSVSFTYLYDVYSENTTRGHYIQMKTVYKF